MSYNLALVYALKAADHRCICQNHQELIRDIAEMGPCAGELLFDIVEEAIDHRCSCGPCRAWLGLALLEHRSTAREVFPPHLTPVPASSRAVERS